MAIKIAYALPDPTTPSIARIVTIGNFDGVHLGHQTLLNETVRLASQLHTLSACVSFSNHPSSIFGRGKITPQLSTFEHKIRLLENFGLDQLFLISFTEELSQLSAEEFLDNLQAAIPFECLVLGQDATLGKDKKGNQEAIKALSKQRGFKAIYLPDYSIDGERVSSSRIRDFIKGGQLYSASEYLGRPYSIYSKVHEGAGRGKILGIQTANLSVSGLCLPPLGVYAVHLIYKENYYTAVANLGVAPTFRKDNVPILEVHILDQQLELYGEYVEIVFRQYIRPEKHFSNKEDLLKQISADISVARELLFFACFLILFQYAIRLNFLPLLLDML